MSATRHRQLIRLIATLTASAGLAATSLAAATSASASSTAPLNTGAVTAGALTAAPALAAGESDTFYTPPTNLSGPNGELLRSEPSSFYLDPLRLTPAPATATRIMYRSSDRLNTKIAVTGTVLIPLTAWLSSTPRPLVAFAVGTQGMGDQCAPSRQMAAGSEYEGTFIAGLLARGWAVVVTDYQGLGTPGTHTYMSREVQGRAVLDSLRAAKALPGTGLSATGKVAISGYSQGGGASAAAIELAPQYAPELNLVGAVAGAPPADLPKVAAQIDGSLYFGFLGYAALGVTESFNVDLASDLNAHGKEVMAALSQQCTFDSLATFGFTRTRDLTTTGVSLGQLMTTPKYKPAMDANLIGAGRRPNVPVLVSHSTLDDVIPYQVGRELAKRWCAQGATVQMSSGVALGHAAGAVESFPKSFAFLESRFAGLPALNTCLFI